MASGRGPGDDGAKVGPFSSLLRVRKGGLPEGSGPILAVGTDDANSFELALAIPSGLGRVNHRHGKVGPTQGAEGIGDDGRGEAIDADGSGIPLDVGQPLSKKI